MPGFSLQSGLEFQEFFFPKKQGFLFFRQQFLGILEMIKTNKSINLFQNATNSIRIPNQFFQ